MSKVKNTLANHNGVLVLERNGKHSLCPFKTRIPMPTPENPEQLHLLWQNCDSCCPLFDLMDNDNLKLHCGTGSLLKIEKKQEDAKLKTIGKA